MGEAGAEEAEAGVAALGAGTDAGASAGAGARAGEGEAGTSRGLEACLLITGFREGDSFVVGRFTAGVRPLGPKDAPEALRPPRGGARGGGDFDLSAREPAAVFDPEMEDCNLDIAGEGGAGSINMGLSDVPVDDAACAFIRAARRIAAVVAWPVVPVRSPFEVVVVTTVLLSFALRAAAFAV